MSAPAKPAARGPHIAALDGVRGLAILMVMAVHFVGDQAPSNGFEHLLTKLGNYGVWGVDLFFVLSGFLITGILHDSKPKPRFFRNFYIRRTLRIFPIYYAILAVLFVLLPAVITPSPEGLGESMRHQAWAWLYGTNIYLGIKNSWALPYISHFWSLAVEEHFYLIWPLVVFACSTRALFRVCVLAIVLALGLRIGLALGGAGAITQYVLTPCRVDALCLGAFLAVAARTSGTSALFAPARSVLWASGGAVLALSTVHVVTTAFDSFVLALRTTTIAIFFGALIVRSLEPEAAPSRFFSNRTMAFFGRYSYGLYLFHGIIGYALVEERVQERLRGALGLNLTAMVAFLAIGLVTSVVVSVMSYELFEKHFLRLKDRWAPSVSAPPRVGGEAARG
jgi:peptidoglycan/LPS O-acetylase OafA/YrhL